MMPRPKVRKRSGAWRDILDYLGINWHKTEFQLFHSIFSSLHRSTQREVEEDHPSCK
jgi:hypothetical protein